jgi:hypothetical protein
MCTTGTASLKATILDKVVRKCCLVICHLFDIQFCYDLLTAFFGLYCKTCVKVTILAKKFDEKILIPVFSEAIF